MGMFSYMCSVSGDQICQGDQVRLYYIENGIVIEEMRGSYNCYGAVEVEDQTYHKVLKLGEMVDSVNKGDELWECREWTDMVSVHFDGPEDSGFVAIHEVCANDFKPSIKSENDPNQGFPVEDEEEYWEE